jgi:hypothetical protein
MTTRAGKAEHGKDKCLESKRTSSDREPYRNLDGDCAVRFDTESREGIRVGVAPQSLRYASPPDSLQGDVE